MKRFARLITVAMAVTLLAVGFSAARLQQESPARTAVEPFRPTLAPDM